MRCSVATASFLFWSLLFSTLLSGSNGGDTNDHAMLVKDGEGTTVVSPSRTFELGFFSRGNTAINRYLGIWFTLSSATIVWVANRGQPLANATGVLGIDSTTGNLMLKNAANATVWSSGLPPREGSNRSVRLLDSGNLVMIDGNAVVVWQSFDYPSDTLLAGMKLGLDYKTKLDRSLTSWKNPSDPAQGEYAFVMDPRGVPQLFVRDQLTSQITYRTGPWNGLRFSGIPAMLTYDMFSFTVVDNAEEAFYQFNITKPGISARLLLDSWGAIQRLVAEEQEFSSWHTFWRAPQDPCDNYTACGPHGVCDPNGAFLCDCLPGFQVKNRDEWYMRNWNGGCVRKTSLNCSGGDGFLLVQQVKLPDTVNCTLDTTMGLEDCRAACLSNCSCTAYATANIKDGSGCIMWTGNLIDIRKLASDGQDFHIRLAGSEIASLSHSSSKNRKPAAVVLVSVLLGLSLIGFCGHYMWRRRKRKIMTMEGGTRTYYADENIRREDPDVPMMDFHEIVLATNNFCDENKIGEGGFGVVYKGILNGEQEVAVKRLSLNSVQGVDEFKNEVTLIAKLQHRNLVRLLGCCINGDERALVYEYMPNKSLDRFIFADDYRKRLLLDWRKRLDIVFGVARGLLYLHQDSRLRIIHRDLKAGNILLDMDMNPKISDFGTARIFGGDQKEVTRRVVGTYGYMSPEYAMGGVFSVKSDVFSFGVLVLEIAWSLWKEDRSLEFLEDRLPCPCSFSEVQRCIQVGLLCVQEAPEDRPSMQQVVLMLGNDSSTLPLPQHPGFFRLRNLASSEYSGSRPESNPTNLMTVTNLEGR